MERSKILMDEFYTEFKPLLEGTIRWQGFLQIASELFKLNKPLCIGETGCLRDPGNWAGDGNSTRIWDWLVSKTKGAGFSIDYTKEYCEIAQSQCPHMIIYNHESIQVLSSLTHLDKLDLLYLDSCDWIPPYAQSELHHAGELAACYSELRSGCLIAVDDCHTLTEGKHAQVKVFFDRLKVQPLLESYITIWRKP